MYYDVFPLHFRYQVNLWDKYFWAQTLSPKNQWIHVVLNYIGPEDGQGMRIYLDGILARNVTTKLSGGTRNSDGRLRLGSQYTSGLNAIDDIDELLFFNNILTDDQIMKVKNMA